MLGVVGSMLLAGVALPQVQGTKAIHFARRWGRNENDQGVDVIKVYGSIGGFDNVGTTQTSTSKK